jgi:hypothetical protein
LFISAGIALPSVDVSLTVARRSRTQRAVLHLVHRVFFLHTALQYLKQYSCIGKPKAAKHSSSMIHGAIEIVILICLVLQKTPSQKRQWRLINEQRSHDVISTRQSGIDHWRVRHNVAAS